MATEFERKFLIDHDEWKYILDRTWHDVINVDDIQQGYLVTGETEVRVRVINMADWFLTIKSRTSDPRIRREWELPISPAVGAEMFATTTRRIVKQRFTIRWQGLLRIEVDQFAGKHEGMVIAEVELQDEHESETLDLVKPTWFGREVTTDARYSNAAMTALPIPD